MEWSKKSNVKKAQETGLNKRLKDHPDFKGLKFAVDKLWKKSQSKDAGEFETDEKLLFTYLTAPIAEKRKDIVELQKKICSDLGVEHKESNPMFSLHNNYYIEIPEPEEKKEDTENGTEKDS